MLKVGIEYFSKRKKKAVFLHQMTLWETARIILSLVLAIKTGNRFT
jgi:hypothetical protein